ncbi:MAG: hypothetical protein IPO04_18260 [Cytophagaceae bacterium]|nr:hypothetical protein [Cytophagaceae bacterium]
MKTIIEINSKIRENYKTVDAVDGIAKMYFNAHEKKINSVFMSEIK